MVTATAIEPADVRRNSQSTRLTSARPSSMLCGGGLERGVDEAASGRKTGRCAFPGGRTSRLIRSTASCTPASTSLRVLSAAQEDRSLDRVDAPRRGRQLRGAACSLDHLGHVANQHRRAVLVAMTPSSRCRRHLAGSRGCARRTRSRRNCTIAARGRGVRSGDGGDEVLRVSPLARRRTGSASTWYSFWKPPKLTTSATPAPASAASRHPVLPAP